MPDGGLVPFFPPSGFPFSVSQCFLVFCVLPFSPVLVSLFLSFSLNPCCCVHAWLDAGLPSPHDVVECCFVYRCCFLGRTDGWMDEVTTPTTTGNHDNG